MQTEPAPTPTEADAPILDIALELFAEVGIKRTSPDDIARRAGINRATLYRRIGAKPDIVRAAILREVGLERDRITDQVDRVADPAERIAYGFAWTVLALRTNRILVKSLVVDPREIVESLTLDAGRILDRATEFTKDWLRKAAPDLRDADEIAGLIVRLMHSLVLTPDAPPRLADTAELHSYATRWICPLVLPRFVAHENP